jgi:tetrahydrodipicolinate N-succinyltransferase
MTHDGGAWVMRLEESNMDLIAPIVVGNNVLIGVNAIIMPGVKIGNDCIVAASSVVSRDVPDGTIVGGIPAKPIKTVAEYREGALKRALYIKGLSPEDKRSYLIGHFDSKGR